MALAKVVQKFDMELFEATEKNVGIHQIKLTSFLKGSSNEIKVKISKCSNGLSVLILATLARL